MPEDDLFRQAGQQAAADKVGDLLQMEDTAPEDGTGGGQPAERNDADVDLLL